MDNLVEAMDPDGVGTISFDSFCKGIQSFLLGKQLQFKHDKTLILLISPDKNNSNGDDDDNDRVQLDVVDYHGDNHSFVGSGDEVGVLLNHVISV